MNNQLNDLKQEEYCYFTTTGRVTGNPHEIEIWFGVNDNTLYLMSGDGKSDWVKNLRKNPAVTVRIAKQTFNATARIVQDEAEQLLARNLLADKYKERESDGSLSGSHGKCRSDWQSETDFSRIQSAAGIRASVPIR